MRLRFWQHEDEERGNPTPLSLADYARMWEQFSWNGVQYLVPGGNIQELTALQGQRNPIVDACISVRTAVLAEVKFTFQRFQAGRPGPLFGDASLSILENPWPAASTGDLVAQMELDNCLYGNSYWVRDGRWLVRLDPTKIIIHTGDVTEQISGKAYGKMLLGYSEVDNQGRELGYWTPDEIIHYKPKKDPVMPQFRGASWLATILPDITADQGLTNYKNGFLQNAATPNLVATLPIGTSEDAFLKFKEKMTARHTGTDNAFKTLYLSNGTDVKTVGSNFADLLFNDVQAAGETRIASAAGVPPTILSLSEGMKGSALNAGNYAATRRRFSDITVRHLLRSMCSAFSVLVPPPDPGARLWYDDRDVAFFQEDVTDAAAIREKDASTIRTLTDGGFEPKSVVAAIQTGDLSQLKHTGLLSVQLQPPGEVANAPTSPPEETGN